MSKLLQEGELLKVALVHLEFTNARVLETCMLFSERSIKHDMQFYAILAFLMEKHHLKNAKKSKQSFSADMKFFGNLKERRDFRRAALAYLKNTKDDKLQFKVNLYDRPYGEDVFKLFHTFINSLLTPEPFRMVSLKIDLAMIASIENDHLKTLITDLSKIVHPSCECDVSNTLKSLRQELIALDERANSLEFQPLTQAEKERIAECYSTLRGSLIEEDVEEMTMRILERNANVEIVGIVEQLVSLSRFTERPCKVEERIDTLNDLFNQMQDEFSASEEFTSKNAENDSLDSHEFADILKTINGGINNALTIENENQVKKVATRTTPRRKNRRTCHEVQNLLHKTFRREVGSRTVTSFSTTSLTDESSVSNFTMPPIKEPSGEYFNPFE